MSSESDAVIANPLRASGLVDAAGLERARAYVRENGGLLSDTLLRLNLVKEGDFLRTFAELYSTRFVKADKLRTLKLDELLLERVGVRAAERLRMCPIRWDAANAELHVVAGVPLSSNLEPELRQLLGAKVVTVYVASSGAIAALIRKAFYRQDDAFAQVTANGAGPPLPVSDAEDPEDGDDPNRHGEATSISRIALPPEPAEQTSPKAVRPSAPGGEPGSRPGRSGDGVSDTPSKAGRPTESFPELASRPGRPADALAEPPSRPARPWDGAGDAASKGSRPTETFAVPSPKAARPAEPFAEPAQKARPTVTARSHEPFSLAGLAARLPADASASDTIPPASSGPLEGKTVMVNLEALTIATLRRENARYRIAQEFHRRVSLERNVETMVDRILWVIFELLQADGAAVWLSSGQFASKAREQGRKIEVPRAVIEQAIAAPGGLLTHNALIDERFDRSESVMVRGVKSVMAVPLRTHASVIGILYVESVSMSAAFTEDDLPLLDSIAAQASILLDNAALVAQVQREVETRVGLSRFLSQAAVDEVLSGRLKVHLEGTASDITVLFADLRGFTTLSSHMRPEEVVRFLNAFFGEAVESVENHGGIVDKFIGDCVMAVWGAVSPREDDARSAIKAALEMVERAGRIRVNGQPLQVGVGINTGSAVVGAIGSKRRSDYTAIGATVNLAARLCGIADPGAVLITADTLMRAGPGIVNEASEAVFLKGLVTPMVPYRVRGIVAPLQLSQPLPRRDSQPLVPKK